MDHLRQKEKVASSVRLGKATYALLIPRHGFNVTFPEIFGCHFVKPLSVHRRIGVHVRFARVDKFREEDVSGFATEQDGGRMNGSLLLRFQRQVFAIQL